jgi:hypothetical protein
VGLLLIKAADKASLNVLSVTIYTCIGASVALACLTLVDYFHGKSE